MKKLLCVVLWFLPVMLFAQSPFDGAWKTNMAESKLSITDLRNGGKYSYVSARRLFWVIRELQAVANAGTAGGAF
jgi:hypothetical protein